MIFAVEGVCYAGKSTLIKNLEQCDKNIKIVLEYSQLASDNNLLACAPVQKDKAIKSANYFLELEFQRQKTIAALQKESFTPVQDRSFLSCVAFDYAMDKIKNRNVWQKVETLFLSQNFVLPDLIFFLQTNQDNVLKRYQKKQDKIPSFLLDSTFNQAFEEYFRQLSYIEIVWIDGNLPAKEVSNKVYQQILTKI